MTPRCWCRTVPARAWRPIELGRPFVAWIPIRAWLCPGRAGRTMSGSTRHCVRAIVGGLVRWSRRRPRSDPLSQKHLLAEVRQSPRSETNVLTMFTAEGGERLPQLGSEPEPFPERELRRLTASNGGVRRPADAEPVSEDRSTPPSTSCCRHPPCGARTSIHVQISASDPPRPAT